MKKILDLTLNCTLYRVNTIDGTLSDLDINLIAKTFIESNHKRVYTKNTYEFGTVINEGMFVYVADQEKANNLSVKFKKSWLQRRIKEVEKEIHEKVDLIRSYSTQLGELSSDSRVNDNRIYEDEI